MHHRFDKAAILPRVLLVDNCKRILLGLVHGFVCELVERLDGLVLFRLFLLRFLGFRLAGRGRGLTLGWFRLSLGLLFSDRRARAAGNPTGFLPLGFGFFFAAIAPGSAGYLAGPLSTFWLSLLLAQVLLYPLPERVIPFEIRVSILVPEKEDYRIIHGLWWSVLFSFFGVGPYRKVSLP
ncbi:MAG: hypothetical protein BWX71_00591 [Deltaproteobacteria bacterium ADurb.Bin072]|nr:MAG: hypothetical protein BWX71_00591 [Deltaproteobacteria bacterium ADurb.Bin072]